ncbi:hypothetical protein UCDDS831_g06259 [Diplodia seriata]|uniref:Uncharacterized protein n=1 Tax=Diplodia seriata TaxID=420778 RepID=A0A0G2G145_9PEZI|nr:hypothetical protein UCDDS831_g06259 [Diplodia seriata]
MASPGPAHDSRHRGPKIRSDEEIRDEIIIDEAEHRIAHPILRPLPLQRGTSDINLRHLFNDYDVVMQQLYDILRACGVVIWAYDFAHRVPPGVVPTDATEVTLVIKSTEFNRLEWEEAVVQVAKKVAQLRNPGPTIIVEIIDYRAINPFTYPIPASNDELIKAWKQWMGQTIMECMSDMEWQTLGLQGRALVPDIAQCRQTVLITVWDASSPYWTIMKANISQATQSFNLAIIVRQAQPCARDTSAKLELYDARIKLFNEWLYGGNPSRALKVESGKTIVYFEETKNQLDTMLADRARVAAAPRLFGHVFAHSGCCRIAGPNNTPLDWALTTLAAPRLLENIFPLAYASTAELFDWQLKDVPGCVVSALMVHNHAEVKTEMGQMTFSEGGDSGSWVFDTETGAWIGVLFGGPLYEEYAYITPVDIILRDVEDVTGKKVVEPKEMK